jgi:hypothetical protein
MLLKVSSSLISLSLSVSSSSVCSTTFTGSVCSSCSFSLSLSSTSFSSTTVTSVSVSQILTKSLFLILRTRPLRPCLLAEWNEMKKLYSRVPEKCRFCRKKLILCRSAGPVKNFRKKFVSFPILFFYSAIFRSIRPTNMAAKSNSFF